VRQIGLESMAAQRHVTGLRSVCFQCDIGIGLLGKRHAAQPHTVQGMTSEWRLHAQAPRSGFASVRLLVSSHIEMGSLCRMLFAVCFSVLISCTILGRAVREKRGAALALPREGPSCSWPFLVCCVPRKRRACREGQVLCSLSRQVRGSGGTLKFTLWDGLLLL